MKTRVIANNILFEVLQEECFLNDAFCKLIPNDLEIREVGFVKDICFGVMRWFHQLSFIKNLLLYNPLKKKDTDISCLILLGLYQILHTNVPDHAAVSETASACRLLKKEWGVGLVNKCLRRFIDEKEVILSSVESNEEAKFSHPFWLIEKIKTAWPKQWEKILLENNKKPPLWIRINKKKINQKEYLAVLKKKNIGFSKFSYAPNSVLLTSPASVNEIPLFFDGFLSVQDISGQFAAPLLDLKKGQRVLDACAAPGSKTSHILETESQLSKLVIVDKDAKRFQRVKENIDRLGLDHKNTQLILADATHTRHWWDGYLFDRILIDAPCSGTGVIRRHPDIKILRTLEGIHHITQVQMQLLLALWKLLKKNGKLLYATCSIFPDENDQIISNFLSHNENAKAEKINLPIGLKQRHGIQIFPENGGADGFYYALLSKK